MGKSFWGLLLLPLSLSAAADLSFPFERTLSTQDHLYIQRATCAGTIEEAMAVVAEASAQFTDIEIYKAPLGPKETGDHRFAFLPAMPKAYEQYLPEEYEGLHMSHELMDNQKRDVLIIRETAIPHVLIHEFAHYLFKKSAPDRDALLKAQDHQGFAERNMDFKLHKFFANPDNQANVRWRMDALDAIKDYVDGMYMSSKAVFAEESIIEVLIAREALACKSKLYGPGEIKMNYAIGNLKNIQRRYSVVLKNYMEYQTVVNQTEGLGLSLREMENTFEKIAASEAELKRLEVEFNKLADVIDATDKLIKASGH